MTYESKLGPMIINTDPSDPILNSPEINLESYGKEFHLKALGPTDRDTFYIGKSILQRDFQLNNTTHGFYTNSMGVIKKIRHSQTSTPYVRSTRFNNYPASLQDMVAAANYYYTNGNSGIDRNWFCDVDLIRLYNYIPVLQMCREKGGEEIAQDPRCLFAKLTKKDEPQDIGLTVVATNINKKGFLLFFTETTITAEP